MAEDTVIAAAASKVTYSASALGFVSSFVQRMDWIAWGSMFVAIGGLYINWYFKRLKNERETQLQADAHVESLQRQEINRRQLNAYEDGD